MNARPLRRTALLSRREEALARASAGLWECRLRDEALEWTGGVYDLFDIPRGTRLQRARILDFYEPASFRLLSSIRKRALATGADFRLDAEIVTARGRHRWIRITASVETEGGRPVRIFGLKQDVTEEITRFAELSRQAQRDALTGLANRGAFDQRLSEAGGRAPIGALLLVDLDGFKGINDAYGHVAGDHCIQVSAARLKETCPDAALVARIGGDEFAVLIAQPVDRWAVEALGWRIRAALGHPIPDGGRQLRAGASVGSAYNEASSGTGAPAELFTRADAALYAAKAAGRNTVRIDREPPPALPRVQPRREGRC
ncbi:GGDEF domain-containing protein [Methylobacterium sp. J-026]|uniref:GGDEF domain-containing protein n=1 Tax=Methylobacterium sp. J-026 TaxID=2836624 RepID=UPI001FBA9567|nr:GGDEF domain-containing protein [Methylobacterium sp. J-026]MCJ2134194.1 GGDEF domain-containing protein [Methylobacterium sp. J-026]